MAEICKGKWAGARDSVERLSQSSGRGNSEQFGQQITNAC